MLSSGVKFNVVYKLQHCLVGLIEVLMLMECMLAAQTCCGDVAVHLSVLQHLASPITAHIHMCHAFRYNVVTRHVHYEHPH